MKHCLILTMLLAMLLAAGAPQCAPAAEPGQARIMIQVYRILGNLSGDMSLTDDIWAGKQSQGDNSKDFSFFTIAKLTAAGHQLTADEHGWRWDGKPAPWGKNPDLATTSGLGVMLIASPVIKVNLGQSAELGVSSDQGIEYFTPRGGSLYELKKMQQPTGLTFRFPTRREGDGRIRLEPLGIASRLVASRKPLAGTTLNVGEPVIRSWEYKADIHLQPDRDYGFLIIARDGQGMLLGRLRVELLKSN